jgi:invasion protein IalB
MSLKHRSATTALVLALTLPPALAHAQAPQFLGTYRDWNVYAFTEDSQKICYMASEPKKQEGNYTRRGEPAVLVTRRPGPRAVDEVSVQPGYTFLDGSEVEIKVGQRTFELFTRGEHAWAKTEKADQELIQAMRRGLDMTVRGTSSKETYSFDTYSLLGFSNAYEAMDEACVGDTS